MAAKTWRLVVTEFGGETPLKEVTVEAVNWMGALQVGRKQIGESGGVPTGASCAVAPDGNVTIHDPVARRTYTLAPGDSRSLAPSTPTGPRVPAEQVPRPEASPPAAAPAQAAPAPAAAAPAAAKGASAPAATKAAPQRAAAKGAPAQAPPAAKAPPKRTVAYDAADLAAHLPKDLPVGGVAPSATPATPPPQAAATSAPAISAPPEESTAGDDWNLLARRDEDPTDASPLRYRERTYVMAPGTNADEAEFVLRERFAALRAALEQAPAGKFFNLAVFDHRWEGRPEKPPVATLQWKDWRGEPEIAFPLRQQAPASGPAPAPRAAAPQPTPQPVATPPPAQPAPAPAAAPRPATAPTPQPVAAPPPAQPAPAPAATPKPAIAPTPQPVAAPPAAQPAPAPAAAPVARAPASFPAPASAPPGAQAPAPESPPKRRRRTKTDEQDARLAHAFEASQDLFFLATPVEATDFVVRLLGELIPCEAVSACLYDINTDEIRFVSLTGPGADERRSDAVPSQTGLMGASVQMVDVALRVDDASKDERFDPGVDGRIGVEARTLLYMPLNHQGRLLGVLQLINRERHPHFTPADADVLAYLSKQTAEFLYQARIKPDHQVRGAR